MESDTESEMSEQTERQKDCSRRREWAKAQAALGTTHIIQNSIPVRYDRRVRVVPCSPDRVPRLPVEILYLFAQALPRPKWVYNLARVNKQSWYYLQPALFQCEVTYEARLKENFGIGDEDTSEECCIGWPDDDPADGCLCRCEGCLDFKITSKLGEKCGDQIAIEKVVFEATHRDYFWSSSRVGRQAMRSDVTALHWACMKGADGVPAGLKAIRSASVHQPSYIDGVGLLLRRGEVLPVGKPYPTRPQSWVRLKEEIPPPLFLSVAFGNAELCEALIEAGCNVNLLRPDEADLELLRIRGEPREPVVLYKIHSNCGIMATGSQESDCPWFNTHFGYNCQTVGHVALHNRKTYMLETLLEGGLDPCLGSESLIHMAVTCGDATAVEILLNRYPELGKLRWGTGSHTPLHLLYDVPQEKQNPQSSIMLAIASYLIQSGADMEAEARPSGFIDDFSYLGTPLQWSLQSGEQGISAAETLITLGSVWNKPFHPSMSREFILDHCISRATMSPGFRYVTREDFEVQRRLGYTLLVRTMIKTTFNCGLEGKRMQPGAEIRQAFLDAFNELAIQSVPLPTQHDAFATEVVGKLLLSTGIAPDAAIVSNWTKSMRKIQGWTAQTLSGRKRSLWEDIMSGRPISHEELKVDFYGHI